MTGASRRDSPGALRLGVIVPCRDEEAVVARKLANLALASWPAAEHRLVVVDDGSGDATAARAREELTRHEERFAAGRVRASVVANGVRPGKPGAIAAGLAELGSDIDLIVLSDADVIVEPAALVALAAAFERDPRLGMACGAQRFVRDLAGDGSARAADGGAPVAGPDAFDRWTARVRALESRCGRLFSVHGQLLAWRAELGLAPTPGLAADDLDLMLQVRARSDARPADGAWRVELVRDARFLEVKAGGQAARGQALRRARAYVQVVRAWDGRAPRRGRWQWRFYRHAPLAAPGLALALALCAVLALGVVLGPLGALLGAVLVALGLATVGRGALELLRCIRRASRVQRAAPLAERWEMARR